MAHINGRKALIVWGGWDGHEPKQVADVFERELKAHGFEVEVANTLDAFRTTDLTPLSLIVPIWTMSTITGEQLTPVLDAVRGGVGLAGCHGGMGDAFRESTQWQWMTGGQWVAHPGDDGIEYTVRITQPDHFITAGAPAKFAVKSEQYYLHTDPSNNVLAVTRFPVAGGPHTPNGSFEMPQIWTRLWGQGRVYYNALGHHTDIVEQADILPLLVRGLLWAAQAEDAA